MHACTRFNQTGREFSGMYSRGGWLVGRDRGNLSVTIIHTSALRNHDSQYVQVVHHCVTKLALADRLPQPLTQCKLSVSLCNKCAEDEIDTATHHTHS